MNFIVTITKPDKTPLSQTVVDWSVKRAEQPIGQGRGTTEANGVLKFSCDDVLPRDRVYLHVADFKQAEFGLISTPASLSKAIELQKKQKASEAADIKKVTSAGYNITQNNRTDWDWLIWETEGNSDPKYQRGGKERKLGLYKLNYDKLRKAGDINKWAEKHKDGTLGGGWVKIGILDQLDYSEHEELMATFLPCFNLQNGKPGEVSEDSVRLQSGVVSRSSNTGQGLNTLNTPPPPIVMPFNYDDNSNDSRAIGAKFSNDPLSKADVKRLTLELTRWSTASRSTITAFSKGPLDLEPHAKQDWDLRPNTVGDSDLPQVKGPPGGKAFRVYQTDIANKDRRYYSVKTGVDFVATQSQKTNSKDLLESNSIHAMSRSNIIAGTLKRVGEGNFEARYQIEILCILLGKEGSWDGIQIREIGNGGLDAVWFPALAIPSHGKAFAEAWKTGCDWVEFWRDNFARPLGRAKGEMMVYFGMQHMTSNAQNFLVAFDRASPGSKSTCTILRDIGDTILHTGLFETLKPIDRLFKTAWDHEVADKDNGIVLKQGNQPDDLKIGGGYSNPQITRIGTNIVFFFPPFLKGDLDTDADPKKAKIIAQWCVASNQGFFDYMKEKVGYRDSWSSGRDAVESALGGRAVPLGQVVTNAGMDRLLVVACDQNRKLCVVQKAKPPKPPDPSKQPPPQPGPPEPPDPPLKAGDMVSITGVSNLAPDALATMNLVPQNLTSTPQCVQAHAVFKVDAPAVASAVRKHADLSLSGQTLDYANLAANVVALSSDDRLQMLQRIESEITAFDPKSKEDVKDLQRLLAGHEILICAEIHNYFQTAAGKQAVKNLHKGAASSGTAPTGPVISCYSCKTVKPGVATGWYRCATCGSHFCPSCGGKLEYPKGTTPSLRAFTTDRRCGAGDCKGYASSG